MEAKRVIEIVSDKTGYNKEAILSGVGSRALKESRRYLMYCLHYRCGMNHRQIGELVNSSPSNAAISVKRVERDLVAGNLNTGIFRDILNEINN